VLNLHGYANEKPLVYVTNDNRYTFRCDRQDLKGAITVTAREAILMEKSSSLMLAMVEFAAHHTLHIYPHMNGFAGYDCLSFYFPQLLYGIGRRYPHGQPHVGMKDETSEDQSNLEPATEPQA